MAFICILLIFDILSYLNCDWIFLQRIFKNRCSPTCDNELKQAGVHHQVRKLTNRAQWECQNENFETGHLFSIAKLNFESICFLAFFDLRPFKLVHQNGPFLPFWGYQKWHFGCPNQNSETTFRDPNHPQNPHLCTLGTFFGPRKVIFGHFVNFAYFYLVFRV